MRKLLLGFLFVLLAFSGLSGVRAADAGIPWTQAEEEYIAAHPVLTMGVDPQFVPFEFIEDGEYKGIAADYVAILEEKTGIDFQVVEGLTWAEAYYQALAGNIDVLPAVSKTAGREEFFLFSDMYYEVKRVIVTLNTDTSIKDLEDLYGRTVAVQINSSHHSFLLQYPEINLSLYNNVPDALAAVSDGSEVAFVGNLATCDYLIKSAGITNLRFSALPTEDPIGIHFAVQKDQQVLVDIIDKVLDSITAEERIEINSRWVTVGTETDYGPVIEIAIIIGSVLLLVAGISTFWIFKLKKEIRIRKKVQEDLEKAKTEAVEANNVKSSFLARMSHEIRTPLNAITGMSYLLKKTNVTLTQRMYCDRITQASQTMLGIINDILDYSKIEAGKVELEIAPFSLDAVIQNLISILSVKIEEKGLGFRLVKDPNVATWFKGDAKRLEQILLNLLNNAVKFTAKGEITLEIRSIAKEKDLHHLSFSVIDTGMGMSKESMDHLFLPFTQADSSINRRFGGTGLGLSIVKNLVEMMKGKIEVYSTEGEGSSFVVLLPLPFDKAKEEEEKKEGSATYFQNVHVLVLEKTASNLNIMDTYLSSFGMRCELTTSPQAAESMLENANGKFADPFDLFLLDYETPAGNGFDFLKALRANARIAKFPKVILLLPMTRSDLFDRLEENGVDIGVGKPVIPSVLHNGIMEIFVNKAIGGSAAADSTGKGVMEKVHVTILVVDDNDTNQLIARLLLEQSGFDVLLAPDGKEGLETFRLRRDDIALILMDLHMPVMNGYEAADEIRKLSPTVPIVAMTAEAVPGVREKCESHGIHSYISKPFDPERFASTLRDILKSAGHPVEFVRTALDKQKGMKQIGDNPTLYGMVLREYAKENKETTARLEEAVKAKRWEEARQIVHKVKGSSGSIGATGLYETAVSLQKAIEAADEAMIATLLREFTDGLSAVLAQIHSEYPE